MQPIAPLPALLVGCVQNRRERFCKCGRSMDDHALDDLTAKRAVASQLRDLAQRLTGILFDERQQALAYYDGVAALVIAVGQLRGALGTDKPYAAEFGAKLDW